jgi:hypothetical protein
MGIHVNSSGRMVLISGDNRAIYISSSAEGTTVISIGRTDIVVKNGVFIFSGIKTFVWKWGRSDLKSDRQDLALT